MLRRLERAAGIEPAYSAWKAAVLPLYYTRTETASAPKGRPPPILNVTATSGIEHRVVGEAGLEPAKLTQGIYSPPPLPLGTFPRARLETAETASSTTIRTRVKQKPSACPTA